MAVSGSSGFLGFKVVLSGFRKGCFLGFLFKACRQDKDEGLGTRVEGLLGFGVRRFRVKA